MRHMLPGQLELPDTPEHPAELAKRLAAAPMLPVRPQEPCDVGLFGTEADQLDMFTRETNA